MDSVIDIEARNQKILELYNQGVPVQKIGRKMHVSESSIYQIMAKMRKDGVEITRPYTYNYLQISNAMHRMERAKKIRETVGDFGNRKTKPISVSSAARICDCSLGTIYGAIYHKKLKASRPRGHWQVKLEDLLEWCES